MSAPTRLSAPDLKHAADLREIVIQHWGQPHRRTPSYDMHYARWRDDGRHASFAVYATHFVDYGGSGVSGDVYSFLETELGLSFTEALAWLADYLNHPSSPSRLPTSQARGPSKARDIRNSAGTETSATDAAWQTVAESLLTDAQAFLWSNRREARMVLKYLIEARGLTPETIKARGYGYNPSWRRVPELETSLAPGIIEAWRSAGQLQALRVRCRVGTLAQALGRRDELGRDGRALPKYLNLRGSRGSGVLFNGDAIQEGSLVLLVEGGFDAALAGQVLAHFGPQSVSQTKTTDDGVTHHGARTRPHKTVGARYISPDDAASHKIAPDGDNAIVNDGNDLAEPTITGSIDAAPTDDGVTHHEIVAVTLGGVSSRPSAHSLAQLERASRVILLLDSDEAGQTAQAHLQTLLADKAVPAQLPTGKDVTEFVVEAGGDLCQVVREAIAPALWKGELPDGIRSALLAYFRPSTAAVIEMLNQAMQQMLLDPQAFTLSQLNHANQLLGFGLSSSSIRRVVEELDGHFFSKLSTESIHPLVLSSGKKGRPSVFYRVRSDEAIYDALLSWCVPRIVESVYKLERDAQGRVVDGTVLRPTPAMLAAIGPVNHNTVEAGSIAPIGDAVVNDGNDPAEPTTTDGMSATATVAGVMAGETLFTEWLLAAEAAMAEDDQDEAQRKAWRLKRALSRLRQGLHSYASTPLLDNMGEWPLNNAANYRAAFLRASNNAEQRRSRRQMRETIGISDGQLDTLLQRAGLERMVPEGEYEFEPITLENTRNLQGKMRSAARRHQGFPKTFVVQSEDGFFVNEYPAMKPDTLVYVASLLQQEEGSTVHLRVQVANHYREIDLDETVAADTPTEPIPPSVPPLREGKPEAPRYGVERGLGRGQTKQGGRKARQRHYGPTHNPDWIADQLVWTLLLLGDAAYRGDDLIATRTGQTLDPDDPAALLACLT